MGFGNIGVSINSALNKPTESPFITAAILKCAAIEERLSHVSPDSWEACRLKTSVAATMVALGVKLDASELLLRHGLAMAMPSAVSELFAAKLGGLAGINTAKVSISETEPSCAIGYIKKRGDLFIESEPIPRAIPVWFLPQSVRTPLTTNPLDSSFPDMLNAIDERLRVWLHSQLDKPSPMSRSQYSDFPAVAESDPIVLRAAMWNSPARLVIHAFRAMLYCSYAHSSNVLVNERGAAYSIDHEKLVFIDGTDDIAELFDAVRHSSKVLAACRQISQLTRGDIERSLSGIDWRIWKHEPAVFNSPGPAIDYFSTRLAAWKRYFPVEAIDLVA